MQEIVVSNVICLFAGVRLHAHDEPNAEVSKMKVQNEWIYAVLINVQINGSVSL
jgi:hypothetical protein